MESFHFRRGSIPLEAGRVSRSPLLRSGPLMGFTLIEMMIVLAIIGIITTVAITGQGSFNKTLILTNAAYDVALTLRSAQSFGISSRAVGTANVGYGIHFTTGKSFLLFADTYPLVGSGDPTLCHTPPANDANGPDARPGDCVYESGSPIDEQVKPSPYNLNNGIYIRDFCVYPAGSSTCASTGLTSVDVVFARPNSEVSIRVSGLSGTSYTSVCLQIASPNSGPTGPFRYVKVESSGAITASATSCLL